MSWVIDGNAADLQSADVDRDTASIAAAMTSTAHARLARLSSLLTYRRDTGCVRRCHGDLHLGNIVRFDGRPTLFDAVEFNDAIACIDVLYDLAFLLMDLWHRDLPTHASLVWNAYLSETADVEALALMPLFLSCRAAVRAKTTLTSAALQSDGGKASALRRSARAYLDLAYRLLQPPGARLIAVGGLSGTGKSMLARALAPAIGALPGAVVLRSDAVRKRLCGVPDDTPLGAEGYTPEMSRRVYAILLSRTGAMLRGGHSVIVDAVFLRAEDRRLIEAAAASARAPFTGFWLDAPVSTRIDRVTGRGPDASDSDADVIRWQQSRDPGTIAWHHIDASRDASNVAEVARGRLREG